MGITSAVAPATRLNRLSEIRSIVGDDTTALFLPGVRKTSGDAKKTLEFASALLLEEAFMNQIILHWPVKK